MIAAAAVGMPVYEQDRYRTRNDLRAGGFSDADVNKAMEFFDLGLTVARTGNGWQGLEAAIPKARSQKWYKLVSDLLAAWILKRAVAR